MFTFGEVESMSRIELLKERAAAEAYLSDLTWLTSRLIDLDEVCSDLMPYYKPQTNMSSFGEHLRAVYAKSSAIQMSIVTRYGQVKNHLAQVEFFLSEQLDQPGDELPDDAAQHDYAND